MRQLVERERPFDPEVPPERYARRHHFAVNPVPSRIALAADFERDYPTYGDWTFDYEYPDYFVYIGSAAVRDMSVYFTPDVSELGQVAVQINRGDDVLDTAAAPYTDPLTPAQLFSIVKPWLDQYAPPGASAAASGWQPWKSHTHPFRNNPGNPRRRPRRTAARWTPDRLEHERWLARVRELGAARGVPLEYLDPLVGTYRYFTPEDYVEAQEGLYRGAETGFQDWFPATMTRDAEGRLIDAETGELVVLTPNMRPNPAHVWVVYVNPSHDDEGLWVYRHEGDARARVLSWAELEEDDDLEYEDDVGNTVTQAVREIATEDLGQAIESVTAGHVLVELVQEDFPPAGRWERAVPP